MRKIRVFIKRPGELPYVTNISDTLENLQKTVGGYIEMLTLGHGLVVICDEEGPLKGYPHNCTINGIEFVGVIIIAGVWGDKIGNCRSDRSVLLSAYPGLREVYISNVNRCVCCGEIIPEGRQVCPNCEKNLTDAPLVLKPVDTLWKEKK